MSAPLVARPEPANEARLRPLLEELGDLKRVRSAGRAGSIAARLFRAAWSGLAGGIPADQLCLKVTASALVAARLGDLDPDTLAGAGLDREDITAVRLRAFDAVAGAVADSLRTRLRAAVDPAPVSGDATFPGFVGDLERQPRAGVTCPNKPRIVLEPPENHAEHCLMVAVYGVLLSPGYGADPAVVFLAALAHHLHNASMPDAGFTGEVLLGEHLDRIVERATAAALEKLSDPLRSSVVQARAILKDAATAEGCAFHAADVIDRVLQVAQHLRASSLTMRVVLDDMHLVHDGPVKPFHDRVLAGMQLA
jgi:5'-deoxynucleotidase YfbR-like HD superfamily hydrolase